MCHGATRGDLWVPFFFVWKWLSTSIYIPHFQKGMCLSIKYMYVICPQDIAFQITKSPLRMSPSLLCLPGNPCLLLICEHTAADMDASGYPSAHASPDSVQNEERSQQGLGKQPGRSGREPARPCGGWARTDGHQRRLHPQVRGPGFQDALSRGLAG